MRANPLTDFAVRVRKRGLVLDGGLATELEARGHDLSDALWSARLLRDDPDAIVAVHRAYLDAGADCLVTASYQATLEGFGSREEASSLLQSAVGLAQEARGDRPALIAASVGPYGAARADGSEYTGDYGGLTDPELLGWHRERFRLLADGGADLLACETLPSFPEARALAALLKEYPDRFAWFSFSCRDGGHLCDGTPIEEAAHFLHGHPQVAAVGVNCTPPRHVEELVRRIRATTTLPILAYPNSGERWDAETRDWSDGALTPADFAELAGRWRAAGALAVGGCCRVGPRFIQRL